MTAESREQSTQEKEIQASEEGATIKHFLAITLGALLVRLWFNFATDHVNAFNNADASEYLRYATALSKLDWSNPHFGPEWREFLISGPTFPFALWLCNFFTGQSYDAANFIPPIAFNSVTSAFTAGFIYLFTTRLFGKAPGIIAGALAIFYPGFIVNTGRLYSETFATFLLCAALALYTYSYTDSVKPDADKSALDTGVDNQSRFTRGNALALIVLGVTVTLLQLTRSAMLLFTAVTAAFVFAAPLYTGRLKNLKQSLLSLALFISGAFLVLAPWFVFEKAAFDKISLVMDRVGHYNLFIGTSTSGQGFLTYPYQDGRGIEDHSYGELIKSAYKSSPSAFIKLIIDKPSRLYKFPWNDYRTPIGPISFNQQVIFHQALILLAAIGLALSFAVPLRDLTRTTAARFYLLSAFLLNLPYLAFITVPRYNLSAMPILLAMAAVGYHCLAKLNAAAKNTDAVQHKDKEKEQEQDKSTVQSIDKIRALAPRVAAIAALFLFVYLRDDFNPSAIFAAPQAVELYHVQPEPLVRGIIAGVSGFVLFAALYLCLPRLSSGKLTLARTICVITAAAVSTVLFLPARAHGRFGELILTLQGDSAVEGTIKLPTPLAAGSENYLLVDCDRSSLLHPGTTITVAGETVGAPLAGLSAVDDWNYLKVKDSGIAMLDCTYIFDCMTQVGAMSNLDVRQWYLYPLPASATSGKSELPVKISHVAAIDHNECPPLKLFGATRKLAKTPALAVYSWEKAFYGVENDRGLTDTRTDENFVRPLNAKWRVGEVGKTGDREAINVKGGTNKDEGQETKLVELGEQYDLNLRILSVPRPGSDTTSDSVSGSSSGPEALTATATAAGSQKATLAMPPDIVSAPFQLATVEMAASDISNTFPSALFSPKLQLLWQDDAGKTVTLPLPWLEKFDKKLAVSVLLDAKRVKGKNLKLQCEYPDKKCTIKLSLRALGAHPLFAPGKQN